MFVKCHIKINVDVSHRLSVQSEKKKKNPPQEQMTHSIFWMCAGWHLNWINNSQLSENWTDTGLHADRADTRAAGVYRHNRCCVRDKVLMGQCSHALHTAVHLYTLFFFCFGDVPSCINMNTHHHAEKFLRGKRQEDCPEYGLCVFTRVMWV